MAKNQMAQMMARARKMQEQMEQMQHQLALMEYPATAGGGMVLAVVSGDLKVRSITINPDVVDPEDVEMLQDMVVAAVNEALATAQKAQNESMNSLTAGMNIPGLNF